MRRTFLPLVAMLSLALSFLGASAQAGGGPEKVFAGKILTSDKKYPSYAKSPAAYVATLKKQSKVNFFEDKAKQTWKIYFAAFFKKGLTDIEVAVKLYDVGQRQKVLLASFEQFVDQRGQKALLSHFTLERKHVGVNKHLLMVIEVSGRPVASGKFKILGEEERLSGKVDFTDEDTKRTEDDE
ncbi:MAG: hypothetical protein KBG48_34490 [Kofleriaceae bacterium]|jgi:hypothetical protein|nr:hypothetical protein [Kofleriaceae bacterium]MBP9172521.1 hypothetical protein [Kofleriaceae bacterium]MBP9861780.1 hypothetical protein [Kofleriaceae bacterium]